MMARTTTPHDNRDKYAKFSALLKSGGSEDHLMIIHAMKDQIVLYKDSVTLVERLILQGKDVRLITLPNSPTTGTPNASHIKGVMSWL